MKLLIASNNKGKIAEIKAVLTGLPIKVIAQDELSDKKLQQAEIAETGTTFAENATLKAQTMGQASGIVTLGDDSGLCVDVLDGRPGVFSKRYGDDDVSRNLKLLDELKHTPGFRRTARFVCAIAICDPDAQTVEICEGQVEGTIALEPKGTQGFGYDPIFIPKEGDGRTFAELGPQVKNKLSHRARALEKAKEILKRYTDQP